MVQLGILAPVTEPTEWCSQISVQVKKSGQLRVCIDPKSLNEALQRESTIEDALPEISKSKVFSKVDLTQGYWHCVLDEESSYVTTIITPFGRYRWLRLPFGTKVSSEIFQRMMNENLEGLEGVFSVADDILIHGESDEAHDANLKGLIERCRERNMRLNAGKCTFRTDHVEFLGHMITAEGVKADPKKTEAILNMQSPTDIEAVRRLQGTVNYLAKFLPNLSDVMEPIRRLTHNGVKWEWSEEQEKAMTDIKRLVTSAPVLNYYDPGKELHIECDASSTGLGAVLMQDGKPIAYTSRALTDTEQGYAQIEKECLAITFSLEKFHQYTFGRQTIVHTHHKPLEAIVRKPLYKAPKRLQSMLLRILQYDVEGRYRRGVEMYMSDVLSRACVHMVTQSDLYSEVNSVGHLRISPDRLTELRTATHKDETMQVLKSVILHGWPETQKGLPDALCPYFSFRDELTVHDDFIFKGERLVVPQISRSGIKAHLHISHFGKESMLRRARECVYWPGMSDEIKQISETCDACQSYCRAQQKETLIPITADCPWEIVGVDLFTWEDREYLLTIDYFSGFWEVDYLPTTTSASVIKKLKEHFARHGSPSKLISDNGPQFIGEVFRNFTKLWDIEHCTSSPRHPNANGKAESGVKAAKSMMSKCKLTKTDPHLCLLEIRNTPTQGTGSSPTQKLFNRRTRSLLPMSANLYSPRSHGEVRHDSLSQAKEQKRQSDVYNKSAKDLTSLQTGDTVRMQPYRLGQKKWEEATVVKQLDQRSYEVQSDGGTFRRNRVHLRNSSQIPRPIKSLSKSDDRCGVNITAERSSISQAESAVRAPQQDFPVLTSHQSSGTETNQQPVNTPSIRRSTRVSKLPDYLKDYVVNIK